MERVMLIVWKWRDFVRKDNKFVVNSELFKDSKFANFDEDLDRFEDTLFDIYEVCDQKPDGKTPPVDPKAIIVRTNIEHSIGQIEAKTFQFLQTLISHLKQKDNELFVFLHRRDGFGEKEVINIKEKGLADKCFLIGAGRDHIYYREERNQGILGPNGYFFLQESSPSKPSIRIANTRKKIVYSHQFNKVWNYYSHEFYTKIFELKEDLLRYLYGIFPDNRIMSNKELYQYLYKYRALSLRVASFIDDDCIRLTESEIKELEQFGREDGKSYKFDDLQANLENIKDIEDEYNSVSKLLHLLFYFPSNSQKQDKQINTLMEDIEKGFKGLLSRLDPKIPNKQTSSQ